MTDEAQIRSSLQIIKTVSGVKVKDERPQPTAFKADVSGTKGPTPGSFTASTAGTDVDLSELITPGFCRMMNMDPTNYVVVGIWDPEGVRFYPILELLPGETYVVRLARDIEEEYGTGNPGTATAGPNTNRLRVKAIVAACVVTVEAHEK